MKRRMSLWLPVILAVFHFIVMGNAFIQASDGSDPEGLAFAVGYVDMPLFVLCRLIPICNFGGDRPGIPLMFLFAGSLTYAFIGFLIGALIDWARNLIERLRDEG